MSNLELWERGRRPNPDHLKWVGVGRGYTTAEAQYQVEKATEIFGPYGIDWGINNLKYSVIYQDDTPVMIFVEGLFWYKWKGEIGEFPMIANKVWSADDDLVKKVTTDLQSKALSKIGIDADLFKGLWGKAGSKKPPVDKVVYLGSNPTLDVPRASSHLANKVHVLLSEVEPDKSAEIIKWLDGENWNHFAVIKAISKLEEI